MKLVIVGEGPKLPLVKEKLAEAGIDFISAADIQELREIVPTLPVLVYMSCKMPPFIMDPVYQKKTIQKLKAQEEIVILLDAVLENRPYEFSLVFEAAERAARMLRPVCVLSRSVRASYPGAEAKYTSAREAGVRFIKYDDFDINQNDDGIYTITATDGADTVSISTSCFIDCSPGSATDMLDVAKTLRLKVYKGRYITNGHWFDHNKSTSRRNVYVLLDSEIGEDGDMGTLIANLYGTREKARNYVAMVDKNKCAFCYTCYRICPHSAPLPDLTARAMLIPEELCEGCGACIAACPAGAIAWDEPLPALNPANSALVLCCENSAYVAASSALDGMNVEVAAMPCGGVISTREMAKALAVHSGVIVAVCINGACKHYDGNLRAAAAVEQTKRELEQLSIDPDRLEIVQVSGPMENIIHDAVARFEGRVKK